MARNNKLTWHANEFGYLIIENAKTLDTYAGIMYNPNNELTAEEMKAAIRERCNVQEVYLYEYNNFECYCTSGKEQQVYNMMKRAFGDAARRIKRIR